MVLQKFETDLQFGPQTLPAAISAAARFRPKRVILQDASMKSLTYGRLMIGADLFGEELKKSLSPALTMSGFFCRMLSLNPSSS